MSKRKTIAAILLMLCSALTACGLGEITESITDDGEAALGNKILVAYYSPNGQIRELSEQVREYTGGELCEIQVTESYPDNLEEFEEAVLEEQRTGRRPEIIVDKEDIDHYDTLLLGFPVWNGEAPMAVPAFLESFDLKGKQVIPFVADKDADMEKLQETIVQSSVGAEVERCTAITGEEEMALWLKQVGVFSELIQIRAGDEILYGGLYQNQEAYEFAERLPLTADLYIPAAFARAFNLSDGMENGEYRTRTYEIGKIAYWPEGPAVAVFIDDSEPQTVVPVIHLGKIFQGASGLAEQTSIMIEKWVEGQNTAVPTDITVGTQSQRGFLNDNTLHSSVGDIHYSSYIPESYDGSEPYALFITLPGWEGLYFQGVGANMVEDFGTEAINYNDRMIVLSTQLDDWGETSAEQTIALTEYFLEHYNIDPDRVYLHGMSGGGETGSLVMGKRPELYAAYLMTSSQWDGDLHTFAQARTPVYMAIAENDSYYGSGSLKEAYAELKNLYEAQGLSEEEIEKLLVLDVKEDSWFTERGFRDTHAGGQAFSHEESVMGWLFLEH